MSKLTTENTCKKKNAYLTKNTAIKAMKVLKSRKTLTGDLYNLKPYLCNICSKWHIGHRYNDVHKVINKLHSKAE